MSEYEFRTYRPGDEHAILASFNEVFAQQDPAFEPRSMEDWRWAYTDNPGGIRVFLALHGDLVAAHYASQPARVWIDGEERIFAQIIDSFVHPEHRRGLKRPGLFVQTAVEMLDEFCGPTKDLVTYGWPIEEAWRMGKRFLRYELVRSQVILSREPGAGPRELPAGVEVIDRWGDEVRDLWRRASEPWGASILRDADYLNWRFVDNPRHEYTRVVVRDGKRIAGSLVFRLAAWPMPASGLVMDWLVPDDDAEVGRLLHEAVLALGRTAGAANLLALFPEWSPWFRRFQERGWLGRPSDYLMSGRHNTPRHSMEWLRDNWWYQFAEMDIV
ncbi:MAG: GNAT family N-acetyltransferase [Planctomycetota bacterium]